MASKILVIASLQKTVHCHTSIFASSCHKDDRCTNTSALESDECQSNNNSFSCIRIVTHNKMAFQNVILNILEKQFPVI